LAHPGHDQEQRVPEGHHAGRAWYWLFLIPYAGLLAVPLYAERDPELFGFPFFYWYQFAWVPLTAAIIWFVYTRTR
jgi:Protein of unknown function (DUF3311)